MRGASTDVDLRMFAAAMVCASKEETRYYLQGVHVEPHPKGGAVMVATDGHRMLVVHDENGKCRAPGIIATTKDLRSAITRAKHGRIVVEKSGETVIKDYFRSSGSGLIEGTFPDWTIIPKQIARSAKSKQRSIATFNSRYLSDFDKMAHLLSDKEPCPVRVIAYTGSDPALILFTESFNAFGILMPMLRGEDLNGVPGFAQPLVEGK